MSYSNSYNIDSINIDDIIEKSRRAREGFEYGGPVTYQAPLQTTTVEHIKRSGVQQSYVPYEEKNYVSSYQVPSYSYQTYQDVNYQPQSYTVHEESVKRSPVEVSSTVYVKGDNKSVLEQRILIIMLGAELERLVRIGSDLDGRCSDTNREISEIRGKLSSIEYEISTNKNKGGNNDELKRRIDACENEIRLLKNNNEAQTSPETDKLRRSFKDKEMENMDLRRKLDDLNKEYNQLSGFMNTQKPPAQKASAWCC